MSPHADEPIRLRRIEGPQPNPSARLTRSSPLFSAPSSRSAAPPSLSAAISTKPPLLHLQERAREEEEESKRIVCFIKYERVQVLKIWEGLITGRMRDELQGFQGERPPLQGIQGRQMQNLDQDGGGADEADEEQEGRAGEAGPPLACSAAPIRLTM